MRTGMRRSEYAIYPNTVNQSVKSPDFAAEVGGLWIPNLNF